MSIFMKVNSNVDYRFIIANIILSQKEKFKMEDLKKEYKILNEYTDELIKRHINEMLDSGLIYEAGNSYKVQHYERNWV